MINRLQPLNSEQIHTIHSSCMKILAETGIVFNDAEALDIFKNHGFKVENKTVFISEEQVSTALKTVPSDMVQGKKPAKSWGDLPRFSAQLCKY